jgi:hypothetical protein
MTHPDYLGSHRSSDLDKLLKWRDRLSEATGRKNEDYTITRVYPCQCCGEEAVALGVLFPRCPKHQQSNPCAIEGCTKTRAANGQLHDGTWWLCSDHWRMACPPHSALRRTYLRFFRTAKKLGLSQSERWPEALENRYWRFWSALVARARRKAAGDVDMAEIGKMFGWD